MGRKEKQITEYDTTKNLFQFYKIVRHVPPICCNLFLIQKSSIFSYTCMRSFEIKIKGFLYKVGRHIDIGRLLLSMLIKEQSSWLTFLQFCQNFQVCDLNVWLKLAVCKAYALQGVLKWTKQTSFHFFNVKDGAVMPYDPCGFALLEILLIVASLIHQPVNVFFQILICIFICCAPKSNERLSASE